MELLGVTTTSHPTLLRKVVVERLLAAAGGRFADVPVVAGSSFVCGTHRPHFLQGNEGKGLGLSKAQQVGAARPNRVGLRQPVRQALGGGRESVPRPDFPCAVACRAPGTQVVCAARISPHIARSC